MRDKTAGFGGDAASYSPSPLLDRYREFLRVRFHGDIRALDRAYTQEDEVVRDRLPTVRAADQAHLDAGRVLQVP